MASRYSPQIHRFSPRNGRAPLITWVFWAGYIGDPRYVATLSTTRNADPDSWFYSITETDELLTIEHPAGPITEDYFERVLAAIQERTGGYVILVGLSRGGQMASDFNRWCRSRPGGCPIPHLGLTLVSAPDRLSSLKAASIVRYLAANDFPTRLMAGTMRRFPGVVVPWWSWERRALRRKKLGRLTKGLLQSTAVSSVWVGQTIRELANYDGFGPSDPSTSVVAVNVFPAMRDKVIDVGASLRAARNAYPCLTTFDVYGTAHATTELDGDAYAVTFRQVRQYFVDRFAY